MKIYAKYFVIILTFGFARAITLFPFIILRHKADLNNNELIEHEQRHIKQQAGLFVALFYILYLLFYIVNRLKGMSHRTAYYNIPFEKDAFTCIGMPSKWFKGWYFWVNYVIF